MPASSSIGSPYKNDPYMMMFNIVDDDIQGLGTNVEF